MSGMMNCFRYFKMYSVLSLVWAALGLVLWACSPAQPAVRAAAQSAQPSPAPIDSVAATPAPVVEGASVVGVAEVLPVVERLSDAALLGPFASRQQFCLEMKKQRKGRCSTSDHPWLTPKALGQRGDILHAVTLLLLPDKDDPSGLLRCVVLLETSQGWWAAVDAAGAVSKGERDDGYWDVALQQFRYADELGTGVLLVERGSEFPCTEPLMIDGREYMGTWQTGAVERRYCAVVSAVPVCTPWMTTWFDQHEVQVHHVAGEIRVTREEPKSGDAAPSSLWAPGQYRLFGEVPLTPFSQRVTEPSIVDELEPTAEITAGGLPGPFDSVRQFCDAPPTVEDEVIDPEAAQQTGEKCPIVKGNWQGELQNKAPGPMKSVRYFMSKGDLAGAPIRYCHVAIETGQGWFVSDSSMHCEGVVGPGRRIERQILDARFTPLGDSQVLEILYEQQDLITEIDPPSFPYDFDRFSAGEQGGGKQVYTLAGRIKLKHSKKSFSAPKARTSVTRSLYLTLCSVGQSGYPSCTTDMYLGCRSTTKNARPLWNLSAEGLQLFGSEPPSYDCDSFVTPPHGTWPLVFP